MPEANKPSRFKKYMSARSASKLPDITINTAAKDGSSLQNSRLRISEVTGGMTRPRLGRGKNSVGAREDLLQKM